MSSLAQMRTKSVSISKFLARILRHQPGAAGLKLDQQGWAEVDDVLAALTAKFGSFHFQQLAELVGTNDKRRYLLSEDGRRIRAAQGHSIPVDLGLEARLPPLLLYHGTKASFLQPIMKTGLVRGRRHHVHLSADMETALKVGSRRTGDTVVLQVRSGEMSGYEFYLSANGVWLTAFVPPEFVTGLDQGVPESSIPTGLAGYHPPLSPPRQRVKCPCPKS